MVLLTLFRLRLKASASKVKVNMSDIQNKQTVSINNSSGVTVGNIENIVHANQSAVNNESELAKVFLLLLERVNALPNNSDKKDAQNAVKALEGEAQKSDKADERTVKKWLYFLIETAPDIGQVAIDTFLNPIKGLSTVFQKVAERAKAEQARNEKASQEQQ